ncbi:class I SAM-dependent methyltransferase [Halorubellus sp. PRR65]|uniref:class I SAM-dependent methyltransferase n=1 Tax=Halorubellus sp. PRR65 TaxID=3098148 RepID=UPI002B25A253|nr:class I SAM-dependent methyltransferase [Halorubellus sp. PRR65]
MEPFQNTSQPDWDWWSRLWPAPGATLRSLGIDSGDALAEVGCGNGYFALPAARVVDPATVFAVDLDRTLLDELDELAALHRIENLETAHADARDMASALLKPVDVVLNANTFHGIDDPGAFAASAHDVLAPDGEFVVVNWHDAAREDTRVHGAARGPPTDLRLSPAATERIVTDAAAFRPIETVDLPPYHYGVRFQKESPS